MFYILYEQIRYAKDRFKIISQHPLTNAFVSNVELLYDREHINNLCQHCNVFDENIHKPDKLTNIFDYREYADNTLYIEKPSYENACHLLSENDYQYIVVGIDQYVNVNGHYINYPDLLSNCYPDLLSNCASVIFKNDAYMLLTVN